MKKIFIALVGRPNVGKSTLFNRLARKRIAIVHDLPGITRDRNIAPVDYQGYKFLAVDTGGFEPGTKEELSGKMVAQSKMAIEDADGIIFLLDRIDGWTNEDQEIFDMLRKTQKPVFLAVNKVDDPIHESGLGEFYESGASEIFPISSAHGRGIQTLLESIAIQLPIKETHEEKESDIISLGIIGQPNVGKSSLVNSFLGEEKQIVHDAPGTTRDPVDSYCRYHGQEFRLIDTAGIRRKSRVSFLPEKFSMVGSLKSIENSDVVLLVIDATQGIVQQDAHIGGYIKDRGKAAIIIVNKWDLIEKDSTTLEKMRTTIREKLKFLDYCPILFVSAMTGKRVPVILEKVKVVYGEYSKRIKTADVNKIVAEITSRHTPPRKGTKVTKFYYSNQIGTKPPRFVITTNVPEAINISYHRFVENRLRYHFGFEGTPIELIWKKKETDRKLGKGGKR